MAIKHAKVSTIPDDADTNLVRPSDWNADHIGTNAHDHSDAENGGVLTGFVSDSGDTMTGDLRGKDFIMTRGGTVTRDGNNYIQTVVKTGGRTVTITRDVNNRVTSWTDATNTWTVTRDGNNRIASWAVT
jgi:hypothetical protein